MTIWGHNVAYKCFFFIFISFGFIRYYIYNQNPATGSYVFILSTDKSILHALQEDFWYNQYNIWFLLNETSISVMFACFFMF